MAGTPLLGRRALSASRRIRRRRWNLDLCF